VHEGTFTGIKYIIIQVYMLYFVLTILYLLNVVFFCTVFFQSTYNIMFFGLRLTIHTVKKFACTIGQTKY
jgi:hypothetical protein